MQPAAPPRPAQPDRGAAYRAEGRSPAVLLIHGFASTPWELRPVAEALSAEGFACAAPVLPGHGQTPRDLSPLRWADWTRALDDAVGTLMQSHDALVLVGMSLGSLLALDAAARWQDRIALRGVVTLACALRLAPLPQTVLRVARALGPLLPDVLASKRRGSDVRDPIARSENPGYRAQPLRAARELLVGQRAARDALAVVRVPLLAVHGLLDRTAPIASSLELMRRTVSPASSLFVAGHSGHLVGVDVDRDAVARVVTDFVLRVAVKS